MHQLPRVAEGIASATDLRAIDPLFGTLAETEPLIQEAHRHGLRVLADIVPNHTSDRDPWFQAALAGGPGSTPCQRYIFRPGRGDDGHLPPNDWRSVFGSPAWTRVAEPDGHPGEWYLHLFSAEQPDLNWDHPEIRAEFESILRFWFDRGIDGFRIDVARVPLPWSGDAPPFGFSPDAATAPPWLPQPEAWKRFTAAAQRRDPESILELYRAALRIRRRHPALGDGTLRWLDAPPDVLAFVRHPGFLCLVNLSAQPSPLPAGGRVLLASSPMTAAGALPADTAAWLAWPT